MKKLALAFALAFMLAPAAPRAQVGVHIDVALPVAPPLVVVQPGIQVVENWDEEVFFTRGYYWVQRDGAWYRARGPRSRFVFVEHRHVPVALVKMPPGRYKHWRKAQAKAERKAWKQHEKAERKAWKEERKHGHH
jgi:hypothetical protein